MSLAGPILTVAYHFTKQLGDLIYASGLLPRNVDNPLGQHLHISVASHLCTSTQDASVALFDPICMRSIFLEAASLHHLTALHPLGTTRQWTLSRYCDAGNFISFG